MVIKLKGKSDKINVLVKQIEDCAGIGYCTVEYPEQYKYCTGSFYTVVVCNVSVPIDFTIFEQRKFIGIGVTILANKKKWEKEQKKIHGKWVA